jgi:carbonic anhydrase
MDSSGRLLKLHVFQLIILATLQPAIHGEGWNYEHPEDWATDYPDCGETNQSPINILDGDVVFRDMGRIRFNDLYYKQSGFNLSLANTGHGVQVNVDAAESITIQDGDLAEEYILAQFHLHWGEDENMGSEHALNNIYYPAEIHFVHYKGRHGSVSDALDNTDGLAVLGLFLEEQDEDNPKLGVIIDNLINITYKDNSVSVPSFALRSLLPDNLSHFYRYEGSLTTPPCAEAVLWTVYEETIKISRSQLGMLRTRVYEGTNSTSPLITHNYRPVQSINSRTVYSNNPYYLTRMNTSGSNSVISTSSLVIMLMVAVCSTTEILIA